MCYLTHSRLLRVALRFFILYFNFFRTFCSCNCRWSSRWRPSRPPFGGWGAQAQTAALQLPRHQFEYVLGGRFRERPPSSPQRDRAEPAEGTTRARQCQQQHLRPGIGLRIAGRCPFWILWRTQWQRRLLHRGQQGLQGQQRSKIELHYSYVHLRHKVYENLR